MLKLFLAHLFWPINPTLHLQVISVSVLVMEKFSRQNAAPFILPIPYVSNQCVLIIDLSICDDFPPSPSQVIVAECELFS